MRILSLQILDPIVPRGRSSDFCRLPLQRRAPREDANDEHLGPPAVCAREGAPSERVVGPGDVPRLRHHGAHASANAHAARCEVRAAVLCRGTGSPSTRDAKNVCGMRARGRRRGLPSTWAWWGGERERCGGGAVCGGEGGKWWD